MSNTSSSLSDRRMNQDIEISMNETKPSKKLDDNGMDRGTSPEIKAGRRSSQASTSSKESGGICKFACPLLIYRSFYSFFEIFFYLNNFFLYFSFILSKLASMVEK